ncbi:MAG: hypothetical protein IPN88_03420 [Bacteroidetes bacterium]|nr:hypothetical protein [Bacteroidota bacterium]
MKKSNSQAREEVKVGNEILKMQLNAEFGMNFNNESTNELPPEIERAWLKSIQRFEKAYAENKTILCYDLIGKPDYAFAETLSKKALKTELKRLLDLLEEHQIVVDCISDISDLEVYKFVTEKLFQEEILHLLLTKKLFIQLDLHPTILRSTFRSFVIANRFSVAITF